MDIYRYFESEDLAAHLKRIGFTFDTLTAVRLILTDTSVPIPQRFADLLEITETMPDVFLDRPYFVEHGESLHEFLKHYIRCGETKLRAFYENNGAVYRGRLLAPGMPDWDGFAECTSVFTSVEACLDNAMRHFSSREHPGWRVLVEKHILNDRYLCSAAFDTKGEPLTVSGSAGEDGIIRGVQTILSRSFFLPHPFKSGDLVRVCPAGGEWCSFAGEPILLDRVPLAGGAGSLLDGYVRGYRMESGVLRYETTIPVTSLEFLREDDGSGDMRTLKRFRELLSGSESLCDTLNRYTAALMENLAHRMKTDDEAFPF